MGGDQASGGGAHGKWAILITVLTMTFMVCLDSSVVTVALPVMQKQLGAGDEIQWVSSVYLIATCLALIPFGRLGDRRGKVHVFQAGVIGFTVGSLLCGLSQTLPALIAARAVQGVGGALAMANNMGIITEAFPVRERGRAMGILSTFVALGMMAGPMLGGIIVSAWPWELIFLINVPVGIASFLVGLRTLPHVRPDRAEREGALGFGEAVRLCLGNAAFRLNFLTMLIVFIGIGASEFILPFYFQDAHGFSADVSGLLFLALPAVNAVVGPVSGTVSDRVGGETLTMLGLAVYIAGFFAVGGLTEVSSVPEIVSAVGLMSLGSAIFQSPNNALFMDSAPDEALGFAGSLGSLARYAGLALGISLCSAMLYGRMSAEAGHAVGAAIPGRPDIFLAGFRFSFHMLAGLVSVAFAMTAVRWARQRARVRRRERRG